MGLGCGLNSKLYSGSWKAF